MYESLIRTQPTMSDHIPAYNPRPRVDHIVAAEQLAAVARSSHDPTEVFNAGPGAPKIPRGELRQIPALKGRLDVLKRSSNDAEILESLAGVIEYMSDDETLKRELCLYVLYRLERHPSLLRPGMGDHKHALAVQALRGLFHNDEFLCSLYLNELMPHVTQLRGFVRIGIRVGRWVVKNAWKGR